MFRSNGHIRCRMVNNIEHSKIVYKFKGFVNIPPLEFIDDVITLTKCSTDSIKMNALVQSKIECKKLELSESKCFKMHLGKENINCPNLKIKNKDMKTTSSERYLGDILTSDCKVDENVKMRHDKGLGLINQIMCIIKEISFGKYHFQVGMMLRTSLLINGMLYSTEAMASLSAKHINQLEECDNIFMRRLFEAESGTPIETFHLEASTCPIKFIIIGRKLVFYWSILKKSEN